MPLKQRSEPVHCVVEEMFVVNSIELATFDHIHGIRKFKDRNTGRIQKDGKSSDKIITIVNMSHHSVCGCARRRFAFTRCLLSASRPEEIVNHRHDNGICPRDWPVSWIDAEAGNPPLDEVAQQVSVITGNLHYETVWAELVSLHQR